MILYVVLGFAFKEWLDLSDPDLSCADGQPETQILYGLPKSNTGRNPPRTSFVWYVHKSARR